jgi:transcriptional regulator with XRE-family HTH domain
LTTIRNHSKSSNNSFGALVRSIRLELNHLFPHQYTQERVAEKISALAQVEEFITNNQISTIESGHRKTLTHELLSYLADVLHLTMHERREFFLVALGVVTWAGMGGVSDDSAEARRQHLTGLRRTIESQPNPAYVLDQYSNVVFSKNRMLQFYGFDGDTIECRRDQPFAFNLMDLWFSEDAQSRRIQERLGSARHDVFTRAVFLFRLRTLRYRHLPYFTALREHLNQYGEFRHYWRKSFDKSVLDMDWLGRVNLREHSYLSDRSLPGLRYFTTMSTMLSPYGELYTIFYIPCDPLTQRVFVLDNGELPQIVDLTTWPVALSS